MFDLENERQGHGIHLRFYVKVERGSISTLDDDSIVARVIIYLTLA